MENIQQIKESGKIPLLPLTNPKNQSSAPKLDTEKEECVRSGVTLESEGQIWKPVENAKCSVLGRQLIGKKKRLRPGRQIIWNGGSIIYVGPTCHKDEKIYRGHRESPQA